MSSLTNIAKALGDDNRLRMLVALEEGELCLCHLSALLGLAPSTTSTHLAILERAGLVSQRKVAQWHFFRLAGKEAPLPAQQALAWVWDHAEYEAGLVAVRRERDKVVREASTPACETRRQRVLFLCTHNSCRSQMAEALLARRAGDRFEAESAGLEPRAIHPLTRKALTEIGVSLVGKRSRTISDIAGKAHFDVLITVCPNAEARSKVFPGVVRRLHWPFEDPAETEGSDSERSERFRIVRDQIDARILEWLQEDSQAAS
jgi:protein-tyrosine-phosphatase/DNA-binding transcriptional ArsR family regulator